MLTEISGAGLGNPVISQAATAGVQRPVGVGVTDKAGVVQPEVTKTERPPETSQVSGAFAQLQQRQDVMLKAAATVREVGGAATQAADLLGKVESSLDQIVKMFPPYPIDSPERVSLLNQIDGLRKQIEQLTFPPPADVDNVGQLLGGRNDVATAVLAGKDRMWDVPELDPHAASDQQIGSALDRVKDVQATLKGLQAGMWQDVVNYVKVAGSPEVHAEDIRNQLADLAGRSIGNNADRLVQAAEP